MRKYILITTYTLLFLAALSSCKKFLDVVPDNVATIDNAFTMRTQAMKFLFTCYSFMPRNGQLGDDPAMVGGDELWEIPERGAYLDMAKGFQSKVGPLGDRWASMYQAIRDCNIFLENIGKVPDMQETERRRWISEVKFLKAYYHFNLVRMYGPIPMIKTNLPISADVNQVKVVRDPVDSCFSYIVQLLDEAAHGLPATIISPATEAGRITQPIALSLKAKVLVTAASPLFNGNTDESGLKNLNGTPLFNTTYSKVKWDSAATACKRAIDACESAGIKLYVYNPAFQQYTLTDTIKTQLSIRNAVTEKWNSEIIWANTQSYTGDLQRLISSWWDPLYLDGVITRGELSPPLKIAEMFYTQNGVPINEDKTWDYTGRYSLRTAGDSDKLYIRKGYTTVGLHFNREPRFYADLGFDGGVYYGQGRYDDKSYMDLFYLEGKFKQRNGEGKYGFNTVTGYNLKKLISFQNTINSSNDYSVVDYPYPLMRLSDLYLLYSEALNESAGPSPEVYKYIDLVRKRAGLGTVASSWTNYSTNPAKFRNQDGMRDIIHQERLIELAFESQRLWDLRRWKESAKELNNPIKGWDLSQTTSISYYRITVLYNQTFGSKDYFWPIAEDNMTANRNLVQNLGW
ncbi:RagB/SusD family nutrient uptake outer membrane protein [Mucilaginibacter sp. BJC16-A38]|uniref:RagB/SusD family nutrient uptake outer membrane protein n=1 Tax=Mucilaginibacter phenanthrenivorans TaxID=1234842 RepID=UPI002157BCEE|nr:RagB/SusD family nutrient uptake outer membrane protein [Mucilaginibacter phenanthrenivorans]MCR8560140.1 RagB/SusD family nutrient uptake outer membrane protein [Mucilaginibacter phenanthrenivorans]